MSRAVPRPLLLVAAVVLAAAVVMVFAGGWRTGVSWDETYHVLRMRTYLGPSGWYVLDHDLHGDDPGSWAGSVYVYAPVTMVLLHAWSMLTGVDGSGVVSASATAYAVRHLGVGLLSLPALAAVAALARILLRSWAWGLVAAAALAAMPAWTGHAMFNVKDVPVATGYTLVSLGFAVVAVAGRRRLVVAGAATAAAGVVLAAGTRPGIWPGLALAALAAVLLARDDRLARTVAVLAAVAAGVGTIALVYPAPFGSPLEALTGSVSESSRFDGASGSRWYVPTFLAAEVPTLLLLLGGLGTVLAVRTLRSDPARAVVALVLLQAFALPLLAIARGSNLYNGLRQLLFAYPALAVLATLGIAAVARRPRAWPVAAVALVVPLLVQARLFPYNYAYSSLPAAALAPSVGDRWPTLDLPTDYWRTSVRELAPELPRGGFVVCQPHTEDGAFVPRSNDGRENCASHVVGPLAAYDDQRGGSWDAPPTEFLATVSGVDAIGDNCTRFADVTRRLWWRTVTMSYAARCDLVLEPYPDAGLDFDHGGDGGAVMLDGWAVHHDDPGIGLDRAEARLGFVLPAWARGHDLVLRGTATGREGLGLAVNGRPVATGGSGATFEASVPAALAAAYGEDRLVVTVTDADADLRLLTMRIETRMEEER